MVPPALVRRAACHANCPALGLCPVCPEGKACQQVIPSSCDDCPMYTCINDPTSSSGGSSGGGGGSKAGPIGGAVGGVLAAMALAGVLFFFWRQRHQRAKRAVKRAQQDAKVRAAGEKFQLGGGKKLGGAAASSDTGGQGSSTSLSAATRNGVSGESRRSGGSKTPDRGVLAAGGGSGAGGDSLGGGPVGRFGMIDDDDETEDINDEDTEWTELRSDGLTAFRRGPGAGSDADSLLEQDPAAFKRRSTGAATHLSRITEGQEDDDEDARSRYREGSLLSVTIQPPQPNSPTAIRAGENVYSSGSSINLVEPYGGGQTTRSRRTKSGQLILDPFSDQASVQESIKTSSSSGQPFPYRPPGNRGSVTSGSAEGTLSVSSEAHSAWNSLPLEHPQRVHRATGAPLIDLQGKPKRQSPSAAITPPLGPLGSILRQQQQQQPSLSTPPGGKLEPEWSPSPLLPHRPDRSPDLNLRLPDGVEPGKIGEDLKSPRKMRSQPRFSEIWNSNEDGQMAISPAAPSTAHSQQFGVHYGDFPAELTQSDVYSHHALNAPTSSFSEKDKRHSTKTMQTVSTMDSMGLDYVLSAPKIVTPDGLKRVQLNQGKAQLVRSLSTAKKEASERGLSSPDIQGSPRFAEPSDNHSTTSDPFRDETERATQSPTTTFGGKRSDWGGEAYEDEYDAMTNDDSPYQTRMGTPYTDPQSRGQSRAQSRASGRSFGAKSNPPLPQRDWDASRDSMPTDVEADYQSRPNSTAGLQSNRNTKASLQHAWTSVPMPPNMSRQSTASSIGGFSILEGIPFRVASSAASASEDGQPGPSRLREDPMPNDAQDKIKEARQAAAGHSTPHSIVYMGEDASLMPTAGTTNSMVQGSTPPWDRVSQAVPSDDNRSSTSSKASQGPFADENEIAVDGTAVSVPFLTDPPGPSSKAGSRSTKFDEIRLQHELDAYPFQR